MSSEENAMNECKPLCLPHLGALRLAGTETSAFLDRQLTVPASKLQPGDGRLACWCEPKGRVVAPLWLVRHAQQAFSVILSAALVDSVCRRLRLYVLRDDVGVQSIAASECVAGVESIDDEAAADWPALSWRPRAKLAVLDVAEVTAPGANAAAVADWRLGDIEHGLPWLDETTTGRFLPQALGMDRWRAIDYNKGCYPGQEIIARTHYRGRLKRGLWRVRVNAAQSAVPGSDVTDTEGKLHGHLLDTVRSDQGAAALAVLHDSCTHEVLSLACHGEAVRLQQRYRVDSGTTSE